MQIKTLIDKVTAMCLPLCKEQNVALWDVTFEKEGQKHVLTIFIDSDDGIQIEQCEYISRAVDPQLDAPEFLDLPPYTLCVSSAGLERRLVKDSHFKWAMGKIVDVTFYKAQEDGSKELSGMLHKKNAEELVLLQGEMEIILPVSKIAGVRLHFEF